MDPGDPAPGRRPGTRRCRRPRRDAPDAPDHGDTRKIAGHAGQVDTAFGHRQNATCPVAIYVEGRTATSNDLVFTVTVDGAGNVTLDQIERAASPNNGPNPKYGLGTLSAASTWSR